MSSIINDFKSGSGEDKDLLQYDINTSGCAVIKPGFFYVDNSEYYMFARMGTAILPLTSGRLSDEPTLPDYGTIFTGGTLDDPILSGLDWIPGEVFFIVGSGDINIDSASQIEYVKVPTEYDYKLSWLPVTSENSYDIEVSGWRPIPEYYYDRYLVYETGTEKIVPMIPIENSKLVITDDGGIPYKLLCDYTWYPYASNAINTDFYARVVDDYGASVKNVVIEWTKIYSDNTTVNLGTRTTDDKGVATIRINTTGTPRDFWIYASIISYTASPSHTVTNLNSASKWIKIPNALSTSLYIAIFRLDSNLIWDCLPAKVAIGFNCFGEEWGTNTGATTGLDDTLAFPEWVGTIDSISHGDWEDKHPALQRPPIDPIDPYTSGNLWDLEYTSGWFDYIDSSGIIDPSGYLNEATGILNGYDWYELMSADYKWLLDICPDKDYIPTYMEDMYVTPEGYWGQTIKSGYWLRTTTNTCWNGDFYVPIDFNYADTDSEGSYNIIKNYPLVDGVSPYDNIYYVLYYPLSSYTLDSTLLEIDNRPFYFRGIALFNDTPNSSYYRQQYRKIKELIMDAGV